MAKRNQTTLHVKRKNPNFLSRNQGSSLVAGEGLTYQPKADFAGLRPNTIGTPARTRFSPITPINQKRPHSRPFRFLVAGEGFEPPTFGL